MRRLLLSLCSLCLLACPSSGGERAASPTALEGSASAVEEVVAEVPAAQAAPAEAPVGDDEASVLVPPPLPELMLRLGYSDPTEVALAEFVPVPPGATGEAGAFGRGEETVRVALIRYANERFAGPHVRDLAERRAILPDRGEAYLHAGRFVLQVEAVDRATADALVARLAGALRWAEQD